MLMTLWQRIGVLLAKILMLLVGIGLLGWAVATAWFAWQHRGPVSADEQIPAGEAAMTQDVIQTAVRIVDQHRENTRYLRDAHAKAHGCLRAEVQVLPQLSEDLRQGVFSEPGKIWQATMRLSNGNAYPQFDSIRDARGMALYTSAQDSRPGASACNGECALTWPPLPAPAEASAPVAAPAASK